MDIKNFSKGEKGFTLVEVLVVAGIIAILAGILVPLILKEIDESRISRAYGDIRAISTAMIIYKKDTGQWPDMHADCNHSVTLLSGGSNLPVGFTEKGFDDNTEGFYDTYFVYNDLANTCNIPNWKGPYLTSVMGDPWGNSYITNASAFRSTTGPIWILSAGPDGVVDTFANSPSLINDDIGLRLR